MRRELAVGNLVGATAWYREAARQQASFGPQEDSPERLAADLRARGVMVGEPAMAGRGSRGVLPLPPVEADAAVSRSAPNPAAGQSLLAARRALAVGDVQSVREPVQRSKSFGAPFHPMGDTPEKVEASINTYAEVMSQRAERGATEAWRRQYAKSLMEQADALLKWRDYDEAEKLAYEASRQRVSFNPYEPRPEVLLDHVARARQQARGGEPMRSEVIQAGAEMVAPATGQDFGRRADAAVYDPRTDATRNIPASDDQPLPPPEARMEAMPAPPGSAMALFQQGESACAAGIRRPQCRCSARLTSACRS